MGNEIQPAMGGDLSPISVQGVLDRMKFIRQIMTDVLKEGITADYAKIPGCGDKYALLKPGAEKLSVAFRLSQAFQVETIDMENGHREYRVKCILNGIYEGVGSCSTLESKYRYRSGPKKVTDKPVPKEYWTVRKENQASAQAMIGAGNGVAKGPDGQWYITEGGGDRVENPDPADQYNTCLKMAKKRAHVDAVISTTGCSDIFTQDIEENLDPMGADNSHKAAVPPPQQRKPEPKPETTAQATPGDASVAQPAAPPAPDTISEAQARRLYAIAKSAKWADENLKAELKAKWGYTSSKNILRAEYEEICDYFQKPQERQPGEDPI